MQQSSVFAKAVNKVANLLTIPAPTGGLNARDSLMAMSPDQAVVLQNLYPQRAGVQLRLGWRKHSTLASQPQIETLIDYTSFNGVEQMFAVAGGKLYDASVENDPNPPVILTGLTNSRWQYIQFTNVNGQWLSMVNGADIPQKYNGTTWTNQTLTKQAGETYPFDAHKLIHVQVFGRRLWFTEKDSGNAWYLPVDQIEGTVTRFGIGETFARGGFLQCIHTWSVDSGQGPDDHIVFISSEGDVVVYDGFDPDDASGSFQIAGVYRIGATLGRRCATKYGSDLLILCEDGVLPLTQILAQSKLLNPVAVSDIIQLKLSEDISLYSANFGWSLTVVHRSNQLYVNVPDPGGNRQYVMNTVTQAWCEFNGYNGLAWVIYGEELHWGGAAGIIAHAWWGLLDAFDPNTETGGAINGYALGAFSFLGRGAYQKHVTMARATINAPTEPQMRLSVVVDFETEDTTPPIPPASFSYQPSLWNHALWDADKWGVASRIFRRWFGVGEIGFCAAPFLKVSTGFGMLWIGTDLLVEEGQGVL